METTATVMHRWEKWPFQLIYFPLSFVWLYYIIRSRAVWFFTPSNPAITFGGMQGETKKEMYERLPQGLYPTTFSVAPDLPFTRMLEMIRQKHLSLPFVVKPEVGEAGILFRKIETAAQLEEYHRKVAMPYMVQGFIHYPIELSVFYYRMPDTARGTITGFLHKVPMHVVGDGRHTLRQLILQHPKSENFLAELENNHRPRLDTLIPAGEKYILSHAANHRKGATFFNLQHEIDDRLLAVFDNLSQQANGWYYGRYDLMCRSVEDLKKGQHFCILEYNGCGAEPNHIYDSGYTLWEAYREIARHWKALYRISRCNARKGIKPWPLLKGWRFLARAKKKIRVATALEKQLSF